MTGIQEMIEKGIPDVIEEEVIQDQVVVDTQTQSSQQQNTHVIEYPITDFSTWFNKHCQKFSQLRVVKASISGIDPLDNIIITVPTNEKDSSGEIKRKIKIFENAKQTKILDADPISFHVFNNGYMVLYRISDNIVIKGYGVKTGMFLTVCHEINNLLFPLSMLKVTKKDATVKILVSNIQESVNKLKQLVDIEALQILYSQITKYSNQIKTKEDIISWFLKKQVEVEDVNHHLQIDEVLLKTL